MQLMALRKPIVRESGRGTAETSAGEVGSGFPQAVSLIISLRLQHRSVSLVAWHLRRKSMDALDAAGRGEEHGTAQGLSLPHDQLTRRIRKGGLSLL